MNNRTAWTSLSNVETGHIFAVGNPSLESRWGWIQEAVAREFEANADDVGCFESDEMDDFATVDGKPVAQVHNGHLRNAAPVEFFRDAAE